MQAELYENISQFGSNQALIFPIQSIPLIADYFKLKTQLKLLDQSFYTAQAGYIIDQNSYITQQFNRKIVQVVESGLMNYWKSQHEVKNVAEDLSGPEVLTLIHLEIGFEIYILCVLISIFAFVCEIVAFNVIN